MDHQGGNDNAERDARLACFSLDLFPIIMRCSLSHGINKKGLAKKYCNNTRNPPVLTTTELLLLKELPKVENFTIQLCYKLISYEDLLPTPSNGWGKFPNDTALEVEDDIERIRHVINEIIAINDNESTDNYIAIFFNELEQIIQRFGIALGNTSIFGIYKSLLIKKIDAAVVLTEIRKVGVIDSEVHYVKLQDRERYSKISAVITEFFPKILRNLIPSFMSPLIVYNICTQPGRKWDKSQTLQINTLQSSNNFESLDASMLYQLFRRFAFLGKEPTQGWGHEPLRGDIEIADDIERIRLLRNTSAHRCDTCIDQTEFDNNFLQFRKITQRIAADYENELTAIAEDSLDPERQIKLEKVLQEKENMKERFSKTPVKYYWGDDVQSKIADIRQRLKTRKDITGQEQTLIEIKLQNIDDTETRANILNDFKKEINKGDVKIEFVGAFPGSLVLYAYIRTETFTTEKNLQIELSSFMTKILKTGMIEITTQWIDAVILPGEGILTSIKQKGSEHLEMNSSIAKSLRLQFNVKMNVFETDERFESEIGACMHQTIKSLNGKGFEEQVQATVDFVQADDIEETIDKEIRQLIPVETIGEIEKEGTIPSGTFHKDKTEETLRIESDTSPIDNPFEIQDENTIVSEKTEETLYMETSQISPINKSVEMEDESTTVSSAFDKACIWFMTKSRKRRSLKRTIPPDLQRQVKEIQIKMPRGTENIRAHITEKNQIPMNIRAQHVQEISEWEQDQTSFVVTRATTHIVGYLQANNCIVVTGSAGCGKSANIHHAALQLRDRYGYEIIPVLAGPTDVINYHDGDKNQVFVVDDICGKETINIQKLQVWRDYSEKMNKIFQIVESHITSTNHGSVSSPKLLISCRLHIYKEPQFQRNTLLTQKECNLLSKEWGLQKIERILMMHTYLPDEIIDDLEQVTGNVDYFPLLCKLAKYKTSEEVKKLFTAPLITIKKNINNIINENKEQFCALVLCTVFNDGFDTDWLIWGSVSEKKNIKTYKLVHIVNEFDIDLSKEKHTKSLKSGLSTLNGTYLKLSGTKYRMIHDKIYQMAAVICGQHLTECFIKYAPPEFIQDHFIFKSLTEIQKKDDSIVLLKDQEEDYFERLVCDLKEHVITTTLHNSQLISQTFRDKLIRFLKRNDDVKTVLEKLDTGGLNDYLKYPFETHYYTTPLIESTTTGYIDIVQFLIFDVKCNVNNTDSEDSSPLYRASERGHSAVAKLLLENNADVSQCNVRRESPLYVACKGGHTDIVELLLQNNADVYQCNDTRESPLYAACKGGYTDTVELLLQNKADVSQCNNIKESPLFAACKGGYTDTVELLLQNKADVSQCNNIEESPLFAACKGGYTDTVKLLLQNKADVSQCSNFEESPLFAACEGGHKDIVELLLQNKTDVSQCNHIEESPLFAACKGGYTDTVKLLLQNKADVSQCSNFEESPLFAACEGGHKDIVELLLQNKTDVSQCNHIEESPLFAACKGGYTDTVELLLQNKADVSQCNNIEESPLFAACKGGYTDTVALLLQNKADVSQCSNFEESPLFAACEGGHKDIVELLLRNNAHVSQYNITGDSPLYAACKRGHTDIVELLLQNKADVNQCNGLGQSPLYAACEGGHKDIVELLLQNNADVSQCNEDKESPLYVASEGGHTDIVELLLQNNADVSQCNDDGESPLCVTCEGGHTDIADLLLRYKTDVTQCNNYGEFPLYVACEVGHTDMADLLLRNNADVSQCNRAGESSLYVACKGGHSDIVKLLLQNNADVSQYKQQDGQSPLHVACEIDPLKPYKKRYSHYIETVKLLLAWNADTKMCNKAGQTPVDIARKSQNIEIVNLLMDNIILKASLLK